MDEEDITLYFDLQQIHPYLFNLSKVEHVGCQHQLSKQKTKDQPAFKFQFGSKKLLFLHGSRSEWIKVKIGEGEEGVGGEEVREVEDNKYLEMDCSEVEKEGDAWKHLQWVLRRLEATSSRVETVLPDYLDYPSEVRGEEEGDVLSLLLTEGCYDHIVDLVLSLLDWNSLQNLLTVKSSWSDQLALYWQSERFLALLESHWRMYVPSQREVRWDREVSAMVCDQRILIVGFTGGGVARYNRNNFSQEYFIIAHHNSTVVKVGHNSLHLVTAGADRLVRVWWLEEGEMIGQLSHPGSVQDMKVGQQRIVTASSNKSLYVLQVQDSSVVILLRLRGHTRLVSCVDYDGLRILSGSQDKTVRLWSDKTDQPTSLFTGHFIMVSDVKLHYPHGISVSWDGTLRLWELTSGNCLRIIEHRLRVKLVSLSQRWLVTADEDSSVFVFSWTETSSSNDLPQLIGVRSNDRRRIGVRSLNTYSGDLVEIRVEDGALVTLINTGDTKDTIEGRIVVQVTVFFKMQIVSL